MKRIPLSAVTVVTLFLSIVGVENAYAIPSFARQTGMSCTACHTAFPELTKVGRDFKLRGYTMGGGTTIMPIPLAGMIMVDLTSVSNGKNDSVQDGNGKDKNGKMMIPQVSLFYGGKIYGKVGAFIQVTYDGTGLPDNKIVLSNTGMDNADIRYADSTMISDKELIYGVSVNNNPTVQDPWNTVPAWGFPYAASSVAPGPAAATLIDGGLGQKVAGATAYAMWDDMIYAEAGVYQAVTTGGIQGILGWHNGGTDPLVYGDAPYGRIALQHDFGNNYVMIGGYGMATKVRNANNNKLDTYNDWVADAEYQYNIGKSNITATASQMWETTNLDATKAAGGADNLNDKLSTTKVKASYYYDHKYGASLAYATTTGTVDTTRYGTTGTLAPDTNFGIAELDYLPMKQYKFSLQYTMYDKFNGASKNYDGAGRNASDNNNLYLIGWLMF